MPISNSLKFAQENLGSTSISGKGDLFQNATFDDIGTNQDLTGYLHSQYDPDGSMFGGDSEKLKTWIQNEGTRKSSSIDESASSFFSNMNADTGQLQKENLRQRLYESSPDRFTLSKLTSGDWDAGFRDAVASSLEGAILDDWYINLLGGFIVKGAQGVYRGSQLIGKGVAQVTAGATKEAVKQNMKREALKSQIKGGFKAGAIEDAAFSAVGEAFQQADQVQIGTRDEMSVADGAVNVAGGALLGGVIGGLSNIKSGIDLGREITRDGLNRTDTGIMAGQDIQNLDQGLEAKRLDDEANANLEAVRAEAQASRQEELGLDGFKFNVETQNEDGTTTVVQEKSPEKLAKTKSNIERLTEETQKLYELSLQPNSGLDSKRLLATLRSLSRMSDPDGLMRELAIKANETDATGQQFNKANVMIERRLLANMINKLADTDEAMFSSKYGIDQMMASLDLMNRTIDGIYPAPPVKGQGKKAGASTAATADAGADKPAKAAGTAGATAGSAVPPQPKPQRQRKTAAQASAQVKANKTNEAEASKVERENLAARNKYDNQIKDRDARLTKAETTLSERQALIDTKLNETNELLRQYGIDADVEASLGLIDKDSTSGNKPMDVARRMLGGSNEFDTSTVEGRKVLSEVAARLSATMMDVKRGRESLEKLQKNVDDIKAETFTEPVDKPIPKATTGKASTATPKNDSPLEDADNKEVDADAETDDVEAKAESETTPEEAIRTASENIAEAKSAFLSILSVNDNAEFIKVANAITKRFGIKKQYEAKDVEGTTPEQSAINRKKLAKKLENGVKSVQASRLLNSISSLIDPTATGIGIRSILRGMGVDSDMADLVASKYLGTKRRELMQYLTEGEPTLFNAKLAEAKKLLGNDVVEELLDFRKDEKLETRQQLSQWTAESIKSRLGEAGIPASAHNSLYKRIAGKVKNIKQFFGNRLTVVELEALYQDALMEAVSSYSITANKGSSKAKIFVNDLVDLRNPAFSDTFSAFGMDQFMVSYDMADGEFYVEKIRISPSGEVLSGRDKWLYHLGSQSLADPAFRLYDQMVKRGETSALVYGKESNLADMNKVKSKSGTSLDKYGFWGRLNWSASKARAEIHQNLIEKMGGRATTKAGKKKNQATVSEETRAFFNEAESYIRTKLDQWAYAVAADESKMPKALTLIKTWENSGIKVNTAAFGMLVDKARRDLGRAISQKNLAKRMHESLGASLTDNERIDRINDMIAEIYKRLKASGKEMDDDLVQTLNRLVEEKDMLTGEKTPDANPDGNQADANADGETTRQELDTFTEEAEDVIFTVKGEDNVVREFHTGRLSYDLKEDLEGIDLTGFPPDADYYVTLDQETVIAAIKERNGKHEVYPIGSAKVKPFFTAKGFAGFRDEMLYKLRNIIPQDSMDVSENQSVGSGVIIPVDGSVTGSAVGTPNAFQKEMFDKAMANYLSVEDAAKALSEAGDLAEDSGLIYVAKIAFPSSEEGTFFYYGNRSAEVMTRIMKQYDNGSGFVVGTAPKVVKSHKTARYVGIEHSGLIHTNFRPLNQGLADTSEKQARIAAAREEAKKLLDGRSLQIADEAQRRALEAEEAGRLYIPLKGNDLLKSVFPEGKEQVTVREVMDVLEAMNTKASFGNSGSTDFPTDPDLVATRLDTITRLEEVVAKYAPHGIRRDVQKRTELMQQLTAIYSNSPEQLDSMKYFFTFLQTRHGRMPKLNDTSNSSAATDGKDPRFSFSVTDNKINVVNPSKAGGMLKGYPISLGVIHETAHWAWLNVLLPEERLSFLKSLGRYVGDDGNISEEAILKDMPSLSRLMSERKLSFNEIKSKPNEIFAMLFVEHATGAMNGVVRGADGTYKGETAGVFGAMIDRIKEVIEYVRAIFTGKRIPSIPEEVQAIFDNLLPPDARQPKFHTSGKLVDLRTGKLVDDSQIKSEEARLLNDTIREYDDYRIRLETLARQGMATDYQQLAAAIKDVGGQLYLAKVASRSDRYRVARQGFSDELMKLLSPKATSEFVSFLNLLDGYDRMVEDETINDLVSTEYASSLAEALTEGAIFKVGNNALSMQDQYRLLNAASIMITSLENAQDNLAKKIVPEGYSAKLNRLYERNPATTIWLNPVEAMTPAEKWLARSEMRAMQYEGLVAEEEIGSRVSSLAERVALLNNKATDLMSDLINENEKIKQENANGNFTDKPLTSAQIEIQVSEQMYSLAGELYNDIRKNNVGSVDYDALKSINPDLFDEVEAEFNNLDDKVEWLADTLADGDNLRSTIAVAILERKFADDELNLKITSPSLQASIEAEARNRSVTEPLGVPENTRSDVRMALERITHRKPEVQLNAQTVGYKILHLMGKTFESDGLEPNDTTNGDLARLLGDNGLLEGDANRSMSQNSPAYASFRNAMRRVGEGLHRNDPSAYRELTDMLIRMKDADRSLTEDVLRYVNGNGLNQARKNDIIEIAESLAYLTSGATGNKPVGISAYGGNALVKPKKLDLMRFDPRSAVLKFGEMIEDTEIAESVLWIRGDLKQGTSDYGSGYTLMIKPEYDFAQKQINKIKEGKSERELRSIESVEAALMDAKNREDYARVSTLTRLFREVYNIDVEDRVSPYAVQLGDLFNLDGALDAGGASIAISSLADIKGKTFNPKPMLDAIKIGDTRTFYAELVRAAGSPDEAKRALAEAGFKGIRDAETALVFDQRSAKSMTEVEPVEIPKITTQNVLSEAVAVMGTEGDELNLFVTAQSLEDAGAPRPVADLVSRMLGGKSKQITPKDIEAVKEVSRWDKVFSKNSDRIRQAGMKTMGDWLDNVFNMRDARTAKTVMPLLNEMDRVSGKVNGVSASIGVLLDDTGELITNGLSMAAGLAKGEVMRQPKAVEKVVRAMRTGKVEGLDMEERKLLSMVADFFDSYYQRQKQAGIPVHDVRGSGNRFYLPQRFDLNRLEKDLPKYVQRMTDYFMSEQDNMLKDRSKVEARVMKMFNEAIFRAEDAGFVPLDSGSAVGSAIGSDLHRRLLRITDDDMERFGLTDLFQNNLRGIITEYASRVESRLLWHEKFGYNNIGATGYFEVVHGGRNGFAKALMRGKTHEQSVGGIEYDLYTSQNIFKPLVSGADEDAAYATAMNITDKVIEVLSAGGGSEASRRSAVQYLNGLYVKNSGGRSDPNFSLYARNLVDGLADGGVSGNASAGQTKEIRFARSMASWAYGRPEESFIGSPDARKWSGRLKAFNSITLLGAATLSSLPDLANAFVRNGSFKAGMKAIKQMVSADPAYRQAVNNIGTQIETVLHDSIAELHGNTAGRFVNAFFKATGLTGWTNFSRKLAAVTSFETIKAHQQVIRQSALSGKQSREYAVAARFLRQVGLQEFLDPYKPAINDINDALKDLRLMTAIHRLTNEAVFAPNKNDVPMWAQTPMRSLMFQFKSYPLLLGRLIKHAVKESWQWEGKPMMSRYLGNPNHLVAIGALGIPMAAGSVYLKDVVLGRNEDEEAGRFDPRERALTKTLANFGLAEEQDYYSDADKLGGWLLESALQYGAFGVLADMLVKTAEQADNGAYGQIRTVSTLFGASVGLAFEGAQLGQTAIQKGLEQFTDEQIATDGEERSFARSIAKRVPIAGSSRDFREGVVNFFTTDDDPPR